MKDTITLAELRKTELYRREQTRPLREFLMENIDVLKLADEVEMWGEDLLALNMKGGIPVIEGATLLRQQQYEIEDLKNANRFIQNFAEEQHQRAVALEMRELTDEEINVVAILQNAEIVPVGHEIWKTGEEFNKYKRIVLATAKALRKAQENDTHTYR